MRAVTDRLPPCTRDPEAWFADDPDLKAYAVRAFAGCHALDLCGVYATQGAERHGVWGGVDRTRRRRPVSAEEVAS